MARVTVEDCVLRVPNRFELVMDAAQRARDIAAGAPLTLDRDDDKNPVVALREIAEETVRVDDLGEALIRNLQKHAEVDEPEEEDAGEFSFSESAEGVKMASLTGEAEDDTSEEPAATPGMFEDAEVED